MTQQTSNVCFSNVCMDYFLNIFNTFSWVEEKKNSPAMVTWPSYLSGPFSDLYAIIHALLPRITHADKGEMRRYSERKYGRKKAVGRSTTFVIYNSKVQLYTGI